MNTTRRTGFLIVNWASAAVVAGVLATTGALLAQPPAGTRTHSIIKKNLQIGDAGSATDPAAITFRVEPFLDPEMKPLIQLDPSGNIAMLNDLDAKLFSTSEQPVEIPDLTERRVLRSAEAKKIFPNWFGDLPDSSVDMQIAARNVTVRKVEIDDPKLFEDRLAKSVSVLAAMNKKHPIALADRVYTGRLEFTIRLASPELATKLPKELKGFHITIDKNVWRCESIERTDFAFASKPLMYKVERGELMMARLSEPRMMALETTTWETAPVVENKVTQVSVPFATCREVSANLPDWRTLFWNFFGTSNGWIAIGVGSGGLLLSTILILAFLSDGWIRFLAFTNAIALAAAFVLGSAYFGANNAMADAESKPGIFNNRRGELSYGIAKISVPACHKKGQLERPFEFYTVRMPENPQDHFIVTDVVKDKAGFDRVVKEKLSASKKKEAFVFIHGFNVSFKDAAMRTAQLCVDLEFDGAPVCYSWPSQNEFNDYFSDSTTAEIASFRLAEFLTDFAKNSGVEKLHIIAHSLGNDVFTRALREMRKPALEGEDCKFREFCLTAPDVDQQVFAEQVVPLLKESKPHVTIYASSKDKALALSRGIRDFIRVGLVGDEPFVCEHADTIDCSQLDTDFLSHAYYGDHSKVIDDLKGAIVLGDSPKKRGLTEKKTKAARVYWELK